MTGKFSLCSSWISTALRKNPRVEFSPAERVFAIEWLFDEILLHAIHDDGGQVNMKTVKVCKQVNSLWLCNIQRILRKLGLKETQMDNPIYIDSASKLRKFVNIFGNCPSDRIPFYHLSIPYNKYGIRRDEYEFTIACMPSLHQCEVSLVELDIHCNNTEDQWSTSSFLVPSRPSRLPNLKTVRVYFEGPFETNRPPRPENLYGPRFLSAMDNVKQFVMGSRDAVAEKKRAFWKRVTNLHRPALFWKLHLLLQRIFTASPNMKVLSFNYYMEKVPSTGCLYRSYDDNHGTGLHLEHFILPPSLEELHIWSNSVKWAYNVDDLLMPLDRLPNLTSLSLGIELAGNCAGISAVFRLLNALRHQLRKLDIDKTGCTLTTIQVPVMTSVEELICGSLICKRHGSPILTTYFPALRKFSYIEVSKSTFHQWVESDTRSLSVRQVHCRFTWRREYEEEREIVEKMSRLKASFPNLTQLTVHFPSFAIQRAAMKYIFQEMSTLQELQVSIYQYCWVNSYEFNAYLLGIRPEEAESLEEHLKNGRETGNVSIPVETSILNLQNLRKLHLSRPRGGSLCYLDVAVRFGISRMLPLVDFTFDAGFTLQASPETVLTWKKNTQDL